jgi:hypothetical protein
MDWLRLVKVTSRETTLHAVFDQRVEDLRIPFRRRYQQFIRTSVLWGSGLRRLHVVLKEEVHDI